MKRGHTILIAGAILLVAGITIAAVWGASFAGSFFENNTLVAETTINAGQSVSAQNHITQLDKPVSLTIGIDKTSADGGAGEGQQQQQTIPANTTLKETVTDPNGRVVSSNEFTDSFITSFKPDVAGVYTVTVTNLGTNPVRVSGTFGYLPFIDSNGNPDINSIMGGAPGQGLGMIIAGGVMAVAGIVTLIVGGIITVADARARSDTATTAGPGGVTYKKD